MKLPTLPRLSIKDVKLRKICDLGSEIICWDDQQNFHAEEEERVLTEEFGNIGFGHLGYDECRVQGMEEDTTGPASQPSKTILLLLLQLLITLLLIIISFDASEIICLQQQSIIISGVRQFQGQERLLHFLSKYPMFLILQAIPLTQEKSLFSLTTIRDKSLENINM